MNLCVARSGDRRCRLPRDGHRIHEELTYRNGMTIAVMWRNTGPSWERVRERPFTRRTMSAIDLEGGETILTDDGESRVISHVQVNEEAGERWVVVYCGGWRKSYSPYEGVELR